MRTAERHELIAERLARRGRIEVAELSSALDTSEVTVRRDLDALERAGLLRRVRGGAVSTMLRGDERPFALRQLEDRGAKRRIAAAAAELIRDGEAVVVDSGTSGVEVARALLGRRLTAMPLSLPAAEVLHGGASIEVVLPGGTVRRGEGSVVGPLAESALAALRFDTALITCCGVSATTGVTAHDLQDAAVKRAAVAAAARVVLVAEAAKFARSALAVVAGIAELDVVVTDAAAPGDALDGLREAGVDVLVA